MKLTVLVDNNTIIDRYFRGEPGVSYFIECSGQKILFDTGYSELFCLNALKLGLDLRSLDAVVLSHGHNDHSWGLGELVRFLAEAQGEGFQKKMPALVAHDDAFLPKQEQGLDIGMMLSMEQLQNSFAVRKERMSLWLTEKLVFLGEIKRSNSFEGRSPLGKTLRNGQWEDDFLLDDSALAYCSSKGLVIITGCSHAGIANIVEQAKSVCGEERIYDVIGGFHLQNPSPEVLEQTVSYFHACSPNTVHAGHCTDLASKMALAKAVQVREIGVGLTLQYE
ncbi:MBL fold metallo-hydrolase [Anaeromusa acidaminophila]|uniref:MBL fold metallo-hydrolase n=1 Tax=Anaeromusa acidaminophila TaxID=81464 RepID=UPI000361CD48|nr:MBL fold metallo-hydrolase [Anaeromusa acidaminophila]